MNGTGEVCRRVMTRMTMNIAIVTSDDDELVTHFTSSSSSEVTVFFNCIIVIIIIIVLHYTAIHAYLYHISANISFISKSLGSFSLPSLLQEYTLRLAPQCC